MNEIILNGKKKPYVCKSEWSTHDLVDDIILKMNTSEELVTLVRVNGQVWNLTSQKDLALIPANELQSVEVTTVPPGTMAAETLETLTDFIPTVRRMALALFSETDREKYLQNFLKMIDGVETIQETVSATKIILRFGSDPVVAVLEADLLSILRDIMDSQKNNETQYLQELITKHLPKNLQDWLDQGIPALIQKAQGKQSLPSVSDAKI